jgi:diaminopimelate decarboxylase
VLNESFCYEDGELCCDGLPLQAIAQAAGTPVYVYSAARLRHNAARLQRAFAPLKAELHYSLKANPNLTLVRMLSQAGLGADAVSAGEVDRALRAGVEPARIVFAGVGKTPAEIAFALRAKIGWFNVESRDELALLDRLAGEERCRPQVALRLNPGIQAQTHPHIATGHAAAKFGMPLETVAEVLGARATYPHLNLAGIHVHIGSQLGSVTETVEAVRLAQSLAAPYADVRTLNIGGGFPVPYTPDDRYPQPEDFAEALAPLVGGWHVLAEPGRAVIADAGVLLIGVVAVKEQGGQRFVIADGGMTDLLRPALYGATHGVVALEQRDGPLTPAVVSGPVCESTDVLHRAALLPPLRAGDLLAVLTTGAYGMAMASNYNLRTRPPEVLVEDGSWRVIRRRETWDDLLRLESEALDEGLQERN